VRRTVERHKVGELRPSQLLYAYGVGSVVDLPNISAMVMGLDDWGTHDAREIGEDRLLAAVRQALGDQVRQLLTAPEPPESPTGLPQPFDPAALVGVPVAPFPRWMLCPYCRLLAPLGSGLFTLKPNAFHPDRTRYVHSNCSKPGNPPPVLPARFLVACERGHLDDFPWIRFVHGGDTECPSRLRLREFGVSGEAADLEVRCDVCDAHRRMSDAFGEEAAGALGPCRGRWPHLREYAEDGCPEDNRAILLGASNSWFPLLLSVLSVPTSTDRLAQLVTDHWATLEHATNLQNVQLLRQVGQLRAFGQYTDEEVWAAVEHRRHPEADKEEVGSLKSPEWRIFAEQDPALNTDAFRLRRVSVPEGYGAILEKVVLGERLREVQALIGFTRIESPGEFDELREVPPERWGPLSRRSPTWLPASEVRGEGIFIQFREAALRSWESGGGATAERARIFLHAHREWRRARGVVPAEAGFPGIRYILLHSFAHVLMRQLALECGYGVASMRERIYALSPEHEAGPMAGVLIYTSAPDSEGTLGGLVRLGEPGELGRHIGQALDLARLCASDPLCAEHLPYSGGRTLHGAACHACLFAPETSCERGNKYLDRTVLVDTLESAGMSFFAGVL
jgi:hypothetical protein